MDGAPRAERSTVARASVIRDRLGIRKEYGEERKEGGASGQGC